MKVLEAVEEEIDKTNKTNRNIRMNDISTLEITEANSMKAHEAVEEEIDKTKLK